MSAAPSEAALQAWGGPTNFDGLPGPTHNYSGLARGNLAAERNAQQDANPREAGSVVIEAEHQCMTVRGVRASGVNTVTSAVHGQLRHDAASRAEFFTLIGSSEQPTPLLNDKAHP